MNSAFTSDIFGRPTPDFSTTNFGNDHTINRQNNDSKSNKIKMNNDADFKKLFEESVKMN